jgi:predicted ester cyclase
MKSAFPSFCLVLFIALVSITLVSHSPQGKGENIKKVKTYWEEVWGKGNLQAKHGEDFSIEGFQKGVSSLRTAFPDFKVTINDIFATGDKVITEVTYTGTHTGKKYFKQEPLGKTVKVPGIDIFTFENGKCVNHQHVADHLDLVMQMGLQLTPSSTDKNN